MLIFTNCFSLEFSYFSLLITVWYLPRLSSNYKFHLQKLNSQSGNLSLQNTDECDMKTVMCLHLDALISYFEKYFSEDMEKHNWIIHPFVNNANASQGFTSLEAEQFMDLSSDLILKSIYNPNSFISFWVKARSE